MLNFTSSSLNQLKSFPLLAAAMKVVQKRKHYIKKCKVLVSLLPESEGTSSESDDNQSEENVNDASSKNVSQFVIYRRSTTLED